MIITLSCLDKDEWVVKFMALEVARQGLVLY